MTRKVTIYLARHAQTSGNVGMKIMEANEDVITSLGKIQTNLLGMHLSEIKFDYAFSSDYGRALKTTEGILKLSKMPLEVPIQSCERLREVDFGMYETTSYKETFTYCKSTNKSIFQWEFPNGESFEGAGQRMLEFIKDICIKLLSIEHSPTILIVGHSAAIAFFLHGLCETTKHKVIGMEKKDLKLMRNACYIKFEVDRSEPKGAIGKNEETKAESPSPLTFKFLEKYYSNHLDCIKDLPKDVNPLLEFAKGSANGKDYVGCIQQ